MSFISWFKEKIRLPTEEEIKAALKAWWDSIDAAVRELLADKPPQISLVFRSSDMMIPVTRFQPYSASVTYQIVSPIPFPLATYELDENEASEKEALLKEMSECGEKVAELNEEQADLRILLREHNRNKRIVEKKMAKYGSGEVPTSLIREFEDEQDTVAEIKERIDEISVHQEELLARMKELKAELVEVSD